MLRYLPRKFFTTIPKVKYVNPINKSKNLLYFATENDIKLDNSDTGIDTLKSSNDLFLKDLKRSNSYLHYVSKQELERFPCTERMLLIQTPLKDLEKVKKIADASVKKFKEFKISELDIKFSANFPLHHRRIVLNSAIMAYHEATEKGNVPEMKDKNKADDNKEDEKEKKIKLNTLNIVEDPFTSKNKNSLNLWINMAKGNLYTRNLANIRGTVASPDFIEKEALNLTKQYEKIKMTVMKGKELENNGLNLLYSVGKAAQSEPRMIILEYNGSNEKTVSHAIVGKGVTFDTGGLNLKPTGYMETMYLDKHGACSALGTLLLAASQNLKINIICVLALAENSIDSLSYKPGDIITSYKGYTVEIGNTDAEGRLCLVDVLSYVQEKYKPKKIIDMATLTGACMIALGKVSAGLFINNDELGESLKKASKEVLEPVWHLPINNDHRENVKGKEADISNSGKDRYGGASNAAAFIENFIEKDVKWAHLDIAGPSEISPGLASGFGTQLVLKYLYNDKYGTDIQESDYKELNEVNSSSSESNQNSETSSNTEDSNGSKSSDSLSTNSKL